MAEWICKEAQMIRQGDGATIGVCLEREKELIRCKDCKNKEKDGISEGFHYCNINGLQVTDDWFCADGSVKQDE